MDEEDLNVSEDILINFDYYFNNYRNQDIEPEKQLMYSVLIYAVIDYLSTNRKSFYRDARKWFYNDEETDYIYSFHNICFMLGVNPKQFRTKLKRMKRSKVKFALDGKRIAS